MVGSSRDMRGRFENPFSNKLSGTATYDIVNLPPSTDTIPLQPRAYDPSISTGYSAHQPQDANLIRHDTPIARPRRATVRAHAKSPGFVYYLVFVGDLLLTFSPCLFLILCFSALSVNEQPISHKGQIVEEAAKLGPTLFPILFAAVAGRLMRTYALWRAERGATLGLLEALNGSQNLLAALERVILLPGLGLIGLGILLLWLLSPVGGQSSLRVLSRGSALKGNETDVYYFNTTGSGQYGAFQGASALSASTTSMKAILYASMISLQKVKGNDLWGNVKVPYLQYTPSYISNKMTDGWYDFSENEYNATYSSMIGVVVSGPRSGIDTNFTMKSSYYNFTCGDRQTFTQNYDVESGDDPAFYGGFYEWAHLTMHTNVSLGLFSPISGDTSTNLNSYIIDTNYNLSGTPTVSKFNLIYASRGNGISDIISAYNCSIDQTFIESRVYCTSLACHITGIRPDPSPPPPLYPQLYSSLPFPTPAVSYPYNLLLWLGTATSLTSSGQVSPIDFYVSGSNTPFSYGREDDVSYNTTTPLQVSQRLGTLFNTAWALSFQLGATSLPPSTNLTALSLSTNSSLDPTSGVGYTTTLTRATTLLSSPIHVASLPWIITTLCVSFIMLASGLTSLFFKYGARSPDILGFVSSMTRDNANFEPIPGGDRLGGLERARVLRRVRVQIADVRPWDGEGHVTLVNRGTGK